MMQTKNEMLESRTEAVSRDALVRAALQEITQNMAFRWHTSASACVRRPARPTRSCCRGTAWRRRPACCAAAI